MSKELRIISLPPGSGSGSGSGDAACKYTVALHSLGINVEWEPLVADSSDALSPKKALRFAPDNLHEQLHHLATNRIDCGRSLGQIKGLS